MRSKSGTGGENVEMCTLGGVTIAVDNHVASVISSEGCKVQDSEKCQEAWYIFSKQLWHSEGSLQIQDLMRAVLRRVANTRSHWIIACCANMEPWEVRLAEWVAEAQAEINCPGDGVSTYRIAGAGGKPASKVLDYLVVRPSLMCVSCDINFRKDVRWLKEEKMLRELPGSSGGAS